MTNKGFISLIIVLASVIILAIIFVLINSIKSKSDAAQGGPITPQRIQQTQDVVDKFQQKSIERQSVDVK